MFNRKSFRLLRRRDYQDIVEASAEFSDKPFQDGAVPEPECGLRPSHAAALTTS
jgi:hypothetical protein